MRASLLLDRGERTFVVVFDKGDEVLEGLTAFARQQRLRASHLTAIGALRDVTLGYFDPAVRDYRKIPVAEHAARRLSRLSRGGREPWRSTPA